MTLGTRLLAGDKLSRLANTCRLQAASYKKWCYHQLQNKKLVSAWTDYDHMPKLAPKS